MIDQIITGDLLPPAVSIPIVIIMVFLFVFDRLGSFFSESFGRGKKYKIIKQKLEIIKTCKETFSDEDKEVDIPDEIYQDIHAFLGYEPEQVLDKDNKEMSYFKKTLRAGFVIGGIVMIGFLIIGIFDGSIDFQTIIGVSISFSIVSILSIFIIAYIYFVLRLIVTKVSSAMSE